jgi:Holliday junction resolvase RusA-like endonuclease
MFDVVGLPAPQGSKTRMPNGALLEGASATGRKAHKAWRQSVAEVARELAEDRPFDGALTLDVVFRFPMPQSRPKTVRALGSSAPKTTKPDIDKLLRSTLDALTDGGLLADDARICEVRARKIEVVGWTGATITLRREDGL